MSQCNGTRRSDKDIATIMVCTASYPWNVGQMYATSKKVGLVQPSFFIDTMSLM